MKSQALNKIKGDEGKFVPVLILLALALIWGGSFILIKRGLDAFTPLQVGALRLTFAFFALLPIALKNFKKIFLKDWKKYLALGVVANLIPSSFFPLAEQGLASSLTGILNSITPITTMIVGVLFFREKARGLQVVGLVISLAGAVMLGLVNSRGGLGTFNYYAIFVLLATVCYGFSSNMVKRFFHNVNATVLTSLQMFSIGGFAILYLLVSDFPTRIVSQPEALASLGYILILGLLNTAFALVLLNRLIQLTSAVFASTVTYLIPITALVWGMLDGEDIFLLHIVSLILILAGVFLVNSRAKETAEG